MTEQLEFSVEFDVFYFFLTFFVEEMRVCRINLQPDIYNEFIHTGKAIENFCFAKYSFHLSRNCEIDD